MTKGRRTMRKHFAHRLGRPLLAAVAVALIFGSATALAGSGVGDVFNLGLTNTVSATSTLTGATAGPQLTVTNTSADPAATALNLAVTSGRAPFKVNSAIKVVSLNADLLDGKDSTALPYWKLGGNSLSTPGILGTTTNQPLELKVNGQRALRLQPNATSPNLIGGFSGNSVDAGHLGSVVAGGGASGLPNHVTTDYDFIGAGSGNLLAGPGGSAIVAGTGNFIGSGSAFIGAGADNKAYSDYDFIGAGQSNTAGSLSPLSAVVGGYNNTVGAFSFYPTVAGGFHNEASGTYSAVAGGSYNTAFGFASFAAGRFAEAMQDGSFVWADSSDDTSLTSPADNTFTVRAAGGIWLGRTSRPSIPDDHFLETSTGAYLTSGGEWTDASDQALKHDFRHLDKRSVLERVARMPIRSWSYKAERPGIRHIGPTAQDFHAAFGLGLDDKHIATLDETGVALAAIQGLYRQDQALQKRVAKLEGEFATHRSKGGTR